MHHKWWHSSYIQHLWTTGSIKHITATHLKALQDRSHREQITLEHFLLIIEYSIHALIEAN